MIIDWFVVLVPLAVLPIVAFFAFVGCQILFPVDPYHQADLIYPADLKQLVREIEVTVEVTGANGESALDTQHWKGEGGLPSTWYQGDLLPAGGGIELFIDRAAIDAEEGGFATCWCSLTFLEGNSNTGVDLKAHHDTPWDPFELTFKGTGVNPTDFHLK